MKKVYLNHFWCYCVVLLSAYFISGCSKGGGNPKPVDNTPALTVTALSVSSGPYTTIVDITGTGFSSTDQDKVFFNGVETTTEVLSSTEIKTSVPLAAGTGPVTVVAYGKTATGPVFTYRPEDVATVFAGSESQGSANGTGVAASFSTTLALATDLAGNVYVADQGNNLIRKITPDGVVTTLAGSGSIGSTDGAGTAASFNLPSGVATDAIGNVYVADKGSGLIRKVTPDGQVSTLTVDATGKQVPYGNPSYLVVDASGNVFFTDSGGLSIREISPAGAITTFFNEGIYGAGIFGMVIDKTGNFFIVDNPNNLIVKISSGIATTFAGTNNLIGGDLDGVGKAASFYRPWGIAIDKDGNLLIDDRGNFVIRKITPAAVVTTFAGQDGINFVGPLFYLNMNGMTSMAIDASGNIYMSTQNVIRKISFQ